MSGATVATPVAKIVCRAGTREQVRVPSSGGRDFVPAAAPVSAVPETQRLKQIPQLGAGDDGRLALRGSGTYPDFRISKVPRENLRAGLPRFAQMPRLHPWIADDAHRQALLAQQLHDPQAEAAQACNDDWSVVWRLV